MNAERYATLAELKSHLKISDTVDDSLLTVALAAASSAVEQYCRRTFEPEGATPTTRYYTPDKQKGVVWVDDIAHDQNVTVKTDDGTGDYATTLAADEYTLEPKDAENRAVPFSRIYSEEWPTDSYGGIRNGVRVDAVLGWPAVPDEVKQAVLIQASRIFNRRNSPYGIAGSEDLSTELRLFARIDPDVENLLRPLRRVVLE